MNPCTVLGGNVGVRRVLSTGGDRMTELCQCLGGVARHGEMHLSADVIPGQLDADVLFALPVGLDVVVSADGVDEMLGMLLPDILDSEVINYQSELDWAPFVEPESVDKGALVVPPRVETFLEQFLRQNPCLG